MPTPSRSQRRTGTVAASTNPRELDQATVRVDDHDDRRNGLEHHSIRRTPSTSSRKHNQSEVATSHGEPNER